MSAKKRLMMLSADIIWSEHLDPWEDGEADVYTQNRNEDTVEMQPQIINDDLRLKFYL